MEADFEKLEKKEKRKKVIATVISLILLNILLSAPFIFGAEHFFLMFIFGGFLIYVPLLAVAIIGLALSISKLSFYVKGVETIKIIFVTNALIIIASIMTAWISPCSQIQAQFLMDGNFFGNIEKIKTQSGMPGLTNKQWCALRAVSTRKTHTKQKEIERKLSFYLREKEVSEVMKYIDTNEKKKNLTSRMGIAGGRVEECVERGGLVNKPQAGRNICTTKGNKPVGSWPAVENYDATYEGCDFIRSSQTDINKDIKFQYCATLSSGTVVKCTHEGCQ